MAARRLAVDSSANPSRPAKVSRGEGVQVGDVDQQAVVDQQLDPLLAQALDVHGRPGGEVGDALHPLARAVEVGAERVALPLEPHQRAARTRDTRSGTSTPACGACPATRTRADHLGDHVAGLAHDRPCPPAARPSAGTWSSLWRVARPTVDPPTNTGSSTAYGVALPGPADRHPDVDAAWWSAPRGGTCRRWPSAAPATSTPAPAAGRGRRPSPPRRRSRSRGRGGAPPTGRRTPAPRRVR